MHAHKIKTLKRFHKKGRQGEKMTPTNCHHVMCICDMYRHKKKRFDRIEMFGENTKEGEIIYA